MLGDSYAFFFPSVFWEGNSPVTLAWPLDLKSCFLFIPEVQGRWKSMIILNLSVDACFKRM